jgi:hypothetical protein
VITKMTDRSMRANIASQGFYNLPGSPLNWDPVGTNDPRV